MYIICHLQCLKTSLFIYYIYKLPDLFMIMSRMQYEAIEKNKMQIVKNEHVQTQ